LAEQVGQSKNQIFRYIRLTELIPELMDMVDESKGPFAWEQAFSLQVAVNHNDCSGIIVQIPNNDRHGLLFCQFTGSVPPK